MGTPIWFRLGPCVQKVCPKRASETQWNWKIGSGQLFAFLFDELCSLPTWCKYPRSCGLRASCLTHAYIVHSLESFLYPNCPAWPQNNPRKWCLAGSVRVGIRDHFSAVCANAFPCCPLTLCHHLSSIVQTPKSVDSQETKESQEVELSETRWVGKWYQCPAEARTSGEEGMKQAACQRSLKPEAQVTGHVKDSMVKFCFFLFFLITHNTICLLKKFENFKKYLGKKH